jgi:hypothetical protein
MRFSRIAALVLLSASSTWAGVKPYPGAKLDKKASAEASKVQPGTRVEVYSTGDAFEKVVAFYKALYKEHAMPAQPPNIAGKPAQWAFFTVDGAKTLFSSKLWFKIQRPYIGVDKLPGGKPDVRNATVIEVLIKS